MLNILEEKKIEVSNIITESDSNEIFKFIKNENRFNPHMLEKSIEEIYHSANNYWWIKLSINGNIIWFMWLYKFYSLFEAGSLCLWEEHRNLWLWTIIQKILLNSFANLPIFLVTNVDKVKHISQKSWLIEVNKSDIPKYIFSIIEEWWELLKDDYVYFNEELFINSSIYSLTKFDNES